VPVDTSAGVSPPVPYPDVEFEHALFHGAGRVDFLHCGGGHIFFDWAPVSGNTPTNGAGVTWGCGASDSGLEVLFQGERHVRLHHEHQGNGFSSASLYRSDDCEGVRVPCDLADQWWSTEYYGEGTG
jgi:hypothetical protein